MVAPPDETAVSGMHKRILIIEDETMMAFLLDDMLTELGYDTAGVAPNYDEASQKIEHESFDAAILDVNLNGQQTLGLAEKLKKKDTPFFFSTGYNQEHLPEEYRDYPILQKPYSMSQLASQLGMLLSGPFKTDRRNNHSLTPNFV